MFVKVLFFLEFKKFHFMVKNIAIRAIQKSDNVAVAKLIREVMTEYDAVGEGFSIEDTEVDGMYEAYADDLYAFFVIIGDNEVLGCGGIAPLSGGNGKTCELRKMYFYPQLRGLGMGRKLLEKCLKTAKEMNYTVCYLETCLSMHKAIALYEKNGFEMQKSQIGATGHTGCDAYFLKDLV